MAAQQHGVVSIGQLREAGLSPNAVTGRLKSGRLYRMHRGVYAVGHPGTDYERGWMAAVLAFPNGAFLSHRSAASLWRLLPPGPGPVDVSLSVHGGRRRRKGIRLHRCPSLSVTMVTRRRGIPVTNPRRTISDLRHTVPPEELRQAIRQADVIGLPIGTVAERDGTRSELEYRFLLLLLRRGRLPMPEVNARIGRMVVDFLWRSERLIVETDGYIYHRGRVAFENDRDRDLALKTLGFEVLHFSYRQVIEEPEQITEFLAMSLRGSGAR
jgi:very-short-patch-repair endonuclease